MTYAIPAQAGPMRDRCDVPRGVIVAPSPSYLLDSETGNTIMAGNNFARGSIAACWLLSDSAHRHDDKHITQVSQLMNHSAIASRQIAATNGADVAPTSPTNAGHCTAEWYSRSGGTSGPPTTPPTTAD